MSRRNQWEPNLPHSLYSRSVVHEAEVIKANYETVENAVGVPLPTQHVFITLPWLASGANPSPYSAHPVPVYTNQHHTPDRKDWDTLKPGTRVLVLEVDKVEGINPLGLAVVAFGPPATNAVYSDVRETSHYSLYPGGEVDKIVSKDDDPISGPNEDYGRTHSDASGYGWESRLPWPQDSNRQEGRLKMPGYTTEYYDRLDKSDTHQSWSDEKGSTWNHETWPKAKFNHTVTEPSAPFPLESDVNPLSQKMKYGRKGMPRYKLPRWNSSLPEVEGLSDYLQRLLLALELAFSTKLDGGGSPASLPKPPTTIATEVVEVD